MTTAEAAPTGDALAFLSGLQLGDGLFPSGRYTLSHGLESFAERGHVAGPGDLEPLIEDYLVDAVGRSEAVAIATANRAAAAGDLATVVDCDCRLHAMKLPAEASAASLRTGATLLSAGRQLSDDRALADYAAEVAGGRAPGNHAVVLGVVGRAWGLAPQQAVLVELYSYAANLLGAAQRTMRLDHVQAQGILRRLLPAIAETAEEALRTDYRDMSAFAPSIEVMQMAHERSRLRLFAS